jgi:hypothetical protein
MSYKPVGLDIAGAMQAADERKLMQSRNALAGAQQAAAQDELNNALAARRYAGGADLNDPQNAMRLFGYGKAGADMFQSLQAGRASSAAARKSQLEASGVKAGQYRQALAFVDSPNAAMEWLQAHHDDPDMQDSPVARMPLDVALSRIPQDPAGFQQWKQQAALGIDKYIERNTLTAEQQSMETDRAEQRGISRGQLAVSQRNAAVNEAAEKRQATSGAALPPAEAARQKALGESQAKFEIAFPQAKADASQAIALIDQMVGTKPYIDKATGRRVQEKAPHSGFGEAVGAGFGSRLVPGTDASSFEALFNQIQGGAFLQAYETLRGGGAITETEGKKATAARNRMALAQSETDFIKAAREYQDVLREGIKRAEARAGGASSANSGVVQVKTDADYDSLPSGTLFIDPNGEQRRKP